MSSDGEWSSKNPFVAKFVSSTPLNAAGSAKDTRHVVIDLAGSNISYLPGDSLGVLARNEPELVASTLSALGADGSETVRVDAWPEAVPLQLVLQTHEISRVPKDLVKLIAETTGDATLTSMLEPEQRLVFKDYADGRDVADVLDSHPGLKLDLQDFVACLRKLNPRLYSIASSQRAHGDHVELCIGVVQWESHGRLRHGVASTYLGLRSHAGDPIDTYVHSGKNFRLPEDGSTDIIMIGPGTGIAPFRAYLEEREATGATGRNWLFFGDQHEATDYLYRDQFKAMQERGVLNRVDLAFSRDQEHKVYVQHRMQEQAASIWEWLAGGAHLYVCGDALRMAKDVQTTLLQIAQEYGKMDEAAADQWLKDLKKAKRYQRDVYAV